VPAAANDQRVTRQHLDAGAGRRPVQQSPGHRGGRGEPPAGCQVEQYRR
jgi:hypothetical protein